jgi:lipopolysaccharide/colanic/teichoic acid biosynthesis glycosyltransferase
MKRCFDLVVGGLALLLLSPLLVLVGIAIRLTSRGPALIRQERIGYRRRPFQMFKFRTMCCHADDAAHRAYVASMLNGDEPCRAENGVYKLVDDPRITGVGRFLRRSSLDELPQLINVVMGTMSLVGPRPMLPWEVELLGPEQMVRYEVPPGVTGLWQVSGRNALTMVQALELDREYVQRHCFRLDLAILLRTVPVVLTGRGAG